MEYKVEACVSISGSVEAADVRATVKQESAGGNATYTTVARCAWRLEIFTSQNTLQDLVNLI